MRWEYGGLTVNLDLVTRAEWIETEFELLVRFYCDLSREPMMELEVIYHEPIPKEVYQLKNWNPELGEAISRASNWNNYD